MNTALETLRTFDENNLPDLDVVVLGALELFEKEELPVLNVNRFRRPLVLGSGNALVTARAIFSGHSALFADETNYESAIFSGEVDGAYIFSASGSKHAMTFARALDQKGVPTVLVTNNDKAPAAQEFPGVMSLVFPKNREPYTYNTSTYMGMLLASTRERANDIKKFIEHDLKGAIPENIADYDAYYFLLPEKASPVAELFITKFDELFGSLVAKRVFTFEQTKHAKTVINNPNSLFVSLGVENTIFGDNRVQIPIPDDAGLATVMAIGYYVIGHIQKGKPQWFKDSIGPYVQFAKEAYGWDLPVIVE